MPDNYDRLRPDFEAEMQLPEWHQMAEKDQPLSISPFVDALKKRMGKPPESGSLGASMGGAMKGGSGGGMQSL